MSGAEELEMEANGDLDLVAARWFSRRRSGLMTAEGEDALAAWLEADPQHRAAFDAIEAAWDALGMVRDHPRVMAMREDAPAAPRHSVLRRAVAAGLAAAVLGVAGFGGWSAWMESRQFVDQSYRTGVGQKSTVKLPDGSEVTLNTKTALRTRANPDRREIYLDQGQAYFKVAKDRSHPFVVHAGGRTITAVGTAFDVRVEQGKLKVTLVEGKIRVEQPLNAKAAAAPANNRTSRAATAAQPVEATELVAGLALTVADDQQWAVARTDTAKITSWVHDQLIFEREPLQEVAEEMNRYSERKIVIADASVARTLVSGNFRPGDVEGFADALVAYNYARISADTPTQIELSGVSSK